MARRRTTSGAGVEPTRKMQPVRKGKTKGGNVPAGELFSTTDRNREGQSGLRWSKERRPSPSVMFLSFFFVSITKFLIPISFFAHNMQKAKVIPHEIHIPFPTQTSC